MVHELALPAPGAALKLSKASDGSGANTYQTTSISSGDPCMGACICVCV